jgi:hypothetical protein
MNTIGACVCSFRREKGAKLETGIAIYEPPDKLIAVIDTAGEEVPLMQPDSFRFRATEGAFVHTVTET